MAAVGTLLSARDVAEEIRAGRLTARRAAEACLARIEALEPAVQAWAFLDRDLVLAEADRLDALKRAGRPLGPLHGVPVGIKDIIDTAAMPTEHGTVLCAGRRPRRDAFVVTRLRDAGALIVGKTVTTELAAFHPGKTRNPHDPRRTPGGSSSGSAAAVAAGMVPLALGSQTNGSVIRPASFCGVVGFKPTHGLIGRTGVLLQSRTLDHVGLFARDIEDAALLGDVLAGFDEDDPDTQLGASPRLLATATAEWPLAPDLAFVRGAAWDQAEPTTREAFEELVAALGERITMAELPESFARANELHRTIWEADAALNYGPLYDRGGDALSAVMRGMIERGREVRAVDWHRAVAAAKALRRALDPLFERYDAVVTPAALGEAPEGLETTGSPAFCTLWTLLGLPAVSLPLLQGPAGLPLGVQLVGPRGDDARLLRTARWLTRRLVRIAEDP